MHYSTKPLIKESTTTEDAEYEKNSYFWDRSIDRDDKALVQVVEEKGKEAFGKHAELKIVQIPDDVDWEISEYDGSEHIVEVHRTWG